MSSGDRQVLIYSQTPKYVLGCNAFQLEYASHGASTRSEVMSDCSVTRCIPIKMGKRTSIDTLPLDHMH